MGLEGDPDFNACIGAKFALTDVLFEKPRHRSALPNGAFEGDHAEVTEGKKIIGERAESSELMGHKRILELGVQRFKPCIKIPIVCPLFCRDVAHEFHPRGQWKRRGIDPSAGLDSQVVLPVEDRRTQFAAVEFEPGLGPPKLDIIDWLPW